MVYQLKDHQFEIVRGSGYQTGYRFGLGLPIAVLADGFHPGESSWATQDATNSRRGNTVFGRDTRGGSPWTFDWFTNGEDPETSLAEIEALGLSWGIPSVYEQALAMQRLRYRVAGRDRCIFGRPRRFSATPNNEITYGVTRGSMEFVPVDGNTYSDLEHSVSVGFTSDADGGGWVFPVVFPLETVASTGFGKGSVYNAGNVRTFPTIRFKGPLTNPSISCSAWTLKLNGSIPENEWVEIDTAPWSMTILNQDGASRMSMLDSRIWLEDCYVMPAATDFRLGGISANSSASCEIRWRDAWATI